MENRYIIDRSSPQGKVIEWLFDGSDRDGRSNICGVLIEDHRAVSTSGQQLRIVDTDFDFGFIGNYFIEIGKETIILRTNEEYFPDYKQVIPEFTETPIDIEIYQNKGKDKKNSYKNSVAMYHIIKEFDTLVEFYMMENISFMGKNKWSFVARKNNDKAAVMFKGKDDHCQYTVIMMPRRKD